MYLSIQKDLEKLRTDGYEAYILGDFYGHVGSGEGGIGGNLPNINFNDRLLQDFVSVNTLKVVNADQGARNRRERQLTRFALPYDYTCFADKVLHLVGPHRKNMYWLNFL